MAGGPGRVWKNLRTTRLMQDLEGLPAKERRKRLLEHLAARRWFTVAATAAKVHLHPNTLRRWIVQNQVRRVTIQGIQFLYLPSAVRRLQACHPEVALALGVNPSCEVCGKETADGETCGLCEKIVFTSIGATLGGDDDEQDT